MKRNNIKKCRQLRKSQTNAEQKLWSILRSRQLSGVKFRRQFPVGSYILDFYCPEYRFGIEADGGSHYEDESKDKDHARTLELAKYGIEIVRFSNTDVLGNIDGICEVVKRIIESKKKVAPHLDPLPKGERKTCTPVTQLLHRFPLTPTLSYANIWHYNNR